MEVEYEPLVVAGNALEALTPDAPRLYDDWEDNKQVHLKFDFGEPDAAFEEADQVMHIKTREGRVTGLPLRAGDVWPIIISNETPLRCGVLPDALSVPA